MRSCFLAILKIAVLNKDNSFVMAFLWLVSTVLLWGVFTVTAQAQKPDSFDECLYCISMNWNRKVLKCKNTTLFFFTWVDLNQPYTSQKHLFCIIT